MCYITKIWNTKNEVVLWSLCGVKIVVLKKREILSKDIETDVLIIGAGMAGLLIGYMLNESGKM